MNNNKIWGCIVGIGVIIGIIAGGIAIYQFFRPASPASVGTSSAAQTLDSYCAAVVSGDTKTQNALYTDNYRKYIRQTGPSTPPRSCKHSSPSFNNALNHATASMEYCYNLQDGTGGTGSIDYDVSLVTDNNGDWKIENIGGGGLIDPVTCL